MGRDEDIRVESVNGTVRLGSSEAVSRSCSRESVVRMAEGGSRSCFAVSSGRGRFRPARSASARTAWNGQSVMVSVQAIMAMRQLGVLFCCLGVGVMLPRESLRTGNPNRSAKVVKWGVFFSTQCLLQACGVRFGGGESFEL